MKDMKIMKKNNNEPLKKVVIENYMDLFVSMDKRGLYIGFLSETNQWPNLLDIQQTNCKVNGNIEGCDLIFIKQVMVARKGNKFLIKIYIGNEKKTQIFSAQKPFRKIRDIEVYEKSELTFNKICENLKYEIGN